MTSAKNTRPLVQSASDVNDIFEDVLKKFRRADIAESFIHSGHI